MLPGCQGFEQCWRAGAGGLPIPRSALEAMSMVAFARQQGVNAFWGGRPDTSASAVKMHWITPDGTELALANEAPRRVLLASGRGLSRHEACCKYGARPGCD